MWGYLVLACLFVGLHFLGAFKVNVCWRFFRWPPLWNMICQKDSGFGRHWRLTYLVIINESGHIHKHSPNGDVLMDFCHMESESHQLCGVLKVVHPRVFPGSCSDKMAGFVGILRTASPSVWRCFLWSEGVTMQWWKWYLCRKQSFDDGSVSPLPKRRRVGKSCQTTGMPLSHVNEADSSGPEAHQPARPKGRAMVMFFEDLQSMSFDLCFLVLPKNLCFNAHKAPGVFLHCCYQGVRVLFTESYPLWRGAKWENKSTAAKPSAEFVTE